MKLLCQRIQLILDENPAIGQIGLREASNASKSVVSQWLDGKIKSLRLDYALQIEKTLGYNHIWLVLGTGLKKLEGGLPQNQSGVPLHVLRLAEKLALVPDEKLKAVSLLLGLKL